MNNYDSVCRKALRSARGAKGYLHDVAVQQPACHNTVLWHFSPRLRLRCCQETCSLLEAVLSQHKASMFAAKPTDPSVWSYLKKMSYEFENQISRGIQIIKSYKINGHEKNSDLTCCICGRMVIAHHRLAKRLLNVVSPCTETADGSIVPCTSTRRAEHLLFSEVVWRMFGWHLLSRKVFLCWDKILRFRFPNPCFIFTNSPQPPGAHFARTFSCNSYNL